MRWREIIAENSNSSASGGNTGRKKKFHKDQNSVIPGATRYPSSAAHYYDMYRYSIHMANNPNENENFDPAGPTANEMVTIAYTKTEQEMHNRSAKAMGFKGKKVSTHGSKEPKDIYSVSPVNNWNKK